MNADPRALTTDAEKAIGEFFARAAEALPGKGAVKMARAEAFARFAASGLPHRRIEAWKYTDLRALMRKALPPAGRPSAAEAAAAYRATPDPLGDLARHRLVLVNGHFEAALSDRAALKKAGVEVAPLSELLASDDPRAKALLASPELSMHDATITLNAAFVSDGVVVTVKDGARLPMPIEIAHVTTDGVATAVRNHVTVGAGAEVRLIETHRGAAGASYQANAMTVLTVGEGARVGAVRLEAGSDKATSLGSTAIALADGASLDHLNIAAGAALSRAQIFLTTGGRHTRAGLYGATMIEGRRHADATLVIDHARPGAETRVLYKSAVDGDGEGVFQGRIVVEQDAQKTDAKMMSKALLLSETAQFAAKPELEIFADDVQCGHGATAGQIDGDHLFYLMARGVTRRQAEELLIEAFLDDAIDALGDQALAPALKGTVAAWLKKRGTSRT